MGPKTIKFEDVLAKYITCKYGVATDSCTSALYLALDGLGIKKGDSVLVPVNTFVATANVVRWLGAEVLFCDVGEDGELDPAKLATQLEKDDKIKCVIPVHLYGFPCDMKQITQLVKKHDLGMVEDCAQSVGAMFEIRKLAVLETQVVIVFTPQKISQPGKEGCLSQVAKKLKTELS